MNKNNNVNDSLKKISVDTMLIYFSKLSLENQENVLKWAKSSKNPNANINTNNPSDLEQNLKMIFSFLNPQEQSEAISQATQMLEAKKALRKK